MLKSKEFWEAESGAPLMRLSNGIYLLLNTFISL